MHPLLKILRSTPALPELSHHWRSKYLQLEYGSIPVGYIPRRLAWMIDQNPHLFTYRHDGKTVSLKENQQQALDKFIKQMYEKKVFTGWRGELYPARPLDGRGGEMFHVERAFAKVFGLIRHSVHINGYIKTDKGEYQYWMGKRAATKSRFPGMLDNIVAGGLPLGYTPIECAVKECWEEASLTEKDSRARLKPTGSITRCCEEEGFLALEEIFIFDIDMEGIIPKPQDLEVEDFSLVDCNEVLRSNHEKVKPDVLIVMIDFMIRHSLVNPDEHSEGYLDLVRALHAPFVQHVSTSPKL